MLETVACIETALCHCNFSGDHPQLEIGYRVNMLLLYFFNNATQCGNKTRKPLSALVTQPVLTSFSQS